MDHHTIARNLTILAILAFVAVGVPPLGVPLLVGWVLVFAVRLWASSESREIRAIQRHRARRMAA